MEKKVEDLRRKLKTIVATLPPILPSHAHQDLVQHGVRCENLTTNYKGRPDCSEDMLRVHKGVNRLQFDLKEIVFSFGNREIASNEQERSKRKHNVHPRTMGIVLGIWRASKRHNTQQVDPNKAHPLRDVNTQC